MRAFLTKRKNSNSPSPVPPHRAASGSPGPKNINKNINKNTPERVNVGSPAAWNPQMASDPATWEEAFHSHWMQAAALIRTSQNSSITVEHTLAVFKHLGQMSLLLMTEVNAQPVPAIGPILDLFFSEQICSTVLDWCTRAPLVLTGSCQVNMLRFYEGLVSQSHTPHHCLLVHKPILLPLLNLFQWCQETLDQNAGSTQIIETERHFVLLLNQICTKMAEDATLLDFFFNCSSDENEMNSPNSSDTGRFSVFTLLIGYLYDAGDIGQLARDAILLVLSVSRKVDPVSQFIGQTSNFCPVLATGLSACFSQLPRRIAAPLIGQQRSEDWRAVTAHDIETCSSLTDFYSALLFCNAVVQVSHYFVLNELLDYIYHGFLVSVVKPALFETGLDEQISATAYLDLCFRTITEAKFLRIFVKFLLVETADENGQKLLDVLIDRVNSTSRLSLVSLSLFQTLIDLHCEDLMVELIFKYLIPCTHLLPQNQSVVNNANDTTFFTEAAQRLLNLTPESLRGTHENEKPQSYTSCQSLADYVEAARYSVQNTLEACSCWTWPYDGLNPGPPEKFRLDQKLENGAVLVSDDEEESSKREPSARSGSVTNSCNNIVNNNININFNRSGQINRTSGRFLNQYFKAKKHASNVTDTDSENHGFTPTDLAILGPNFLLTDDVLEEDRSVDYNDEQSADETTRPFVSTVSNLTDNESTVLGANFTYRTSPAIDYFKFAYDELTESEIEPAKNDPRNFSGDMEPDYHDSNDRKKPSIDPFINGQSTDYSKNNSEAECRKSLEFKGWACIDNTDAFVEVLGKVQTSKETIGHSLEENMALIDSKIQYMNELRAEREAFIREGQEADEENRSQNATNLSTEQKRSNFGLNLDYRGSISRPTIGPFLNAILKKLENMLENDLYVNLQLTGVLAQLASHPQHLLTSFLLDFRLELHSSVKSLFQILTELKTKIDSESSHVNRFDLLLARGIKTLNARRRRYERVLDGGTRPYATSQTRRSPVPEAVALETHGFNVDPDMQPRTILDILGEKSKKQAAKFGAGKKSSSRSESEGSSTGQNDRAGFKYFNHKTLETDETALNAIKTKNLVYTAILLAEFLQELASIAKEQPLALMPPPLYW